jgi:dihydroorotate dehydrogenase electron transfer subunit
MQLVQAIISEIEEVAPGHCRLKMIAPEIAAAAKPGQFVEVRVGNDDSVDPLLARPISIFRINKGEGSISLLFKIVGRGTKLLASKVKGENIMTWGPIGNGFSIPEGAKNIALIAGGIGMPPLFCLQEHLASSPNPPQITLFYGGRTSRDFLEMDLWEKNQTRVKLATEDGSTGFKGLVTDLFVSEHQSNHYDLLVACGPAPMLAAIQKIASLTGLSGQISLESYMACGVGACLGCVCQTGKGSRRVCVDGPVFSIEEVIFS